MSHQIYLRQYGIRVLATWVLFTSVCCSFVAAEAVAEAVKTNGIAASLQPFVDRGTLAGAVMLVTTREKTVSHDTVGMADIAVKKAMSPDALFWIASMSKPLTGTALMMLVDEGKVKLEEPVSTYIPEFATVMVTVKNGGQVTYQKPVRPITVRDVMCHTSGMVFLLLAEKGKIDVLSIADSVAQSIKVPLLFEPGSAYQYSNCGINTGGRIIEIVSGKSYEQFMRERLFEPLGMRDTCSVLSPDQLKRLAKSYRPNADKTMLNEVEINYLTYPLDAATRHPCPGGGFFSSAADLGLFARLLLSGGQLNGRRFVSEASFKIMTSKQTGNLAANYGIGFALDGGGNGFGHGGAYATDIWIDSKQGFATIFMVQHNGYAGTDGGKILSTFRQAARVAAAP